MGKLVARGLEVDEISTGCGKTAPYTANSKNVYVEGVLAHVDGNFNSFHPFDLPLLLCFASHRSPVKATTSSVFVGGKSVARLGDKYDDVQMHGGVATTIRISNVTQKSVFAG